MLKTFDTIRHCPLRALIAVVALFPVLQWLLTSTAFAQAASQGLETIHIGTVSGQLNTPDAFALFPTTWTTSFPVTSSRWKALLISIA